MSAHTDPTVGLTGARFGRVPRYLQPPLPQPPDATPESPDDDDPPAPTGARFARASRRQARPTPPPTRPEPPLNAEHSSSNEHTGRTERRTETAPDPDADFASAPTVRVRPYVHTGGRTRTHTPLPIEALVCAVPGSSALRLHGTHRAVLELCRVPQSVAEVSARLGVPLAVARVLVEDLVAVQMVTVQRGVDENAPDIALMRRLLAGLQRL